MNKEKINELLQEAGMMVEGKQDEGFIGAYFTAPEGKVQMSVTECGNIAPLAFLIARIIICISATHNVRPDKMMSFVRRSYKLMLKYHKRGLPIGEFEARDLGTD